MKVFKKHFGELSGRSIALFTLQNNNGMVVKVTNYGCTVTSIQLPRTDGLKDDIACGFDTFDGYFSPEYKANSPYFGSIVGRYASMLKDGVFNLDGVQYQLAKNAGKNHLHGGIVAFNKRVWDAVVLEDNDSVSVVFKLTSPDGEEGYPGKLDVTVVYTLTNKNELQVLCDATADKRTPLSMTHHSYFNLNGFTSNILEHEVEINSCQFLEVDETGAATGRKIPAEGATDFNTSKKLGDAFEVLPLGFEHFYTFENPNETLVQVAQIQEKKLGRKLTVLTTEPGMLFYTGRYTSNELKREDGTQFGQFRAFCCEASRYPNGPNLKNAPNCIFGPDRPYHSETVYRFSW